MVSAQIYLSLWPRKPRFLVSESDNQIAYTLHKYENHALGYHQWAFIGNAILIFIDSYEELEIIEVP